MIRQLGTPETRESYLDTQDLHLLLAVLLFGGGPSPPPSHELLSPMHDLISAEAIPPGALTAVDAGLGFAAAEKAAATRAA
jgi:hypothetical protein